MIELLFIMLVIFLARFLIKEDDVSISADPGLSLDQGVISVYGIEDSRQHWNLIKTYKLEENEDV